MQHKCQYISFDKAKNVPCLDVLLTLMGTILNGKYVVSACTLYNATKYVRIAVFPSSYDPDCHTITWLDALGYFFNVTGCGQNRHLCFDDTLCVCCSQLCWCLLPDADNARMHISNKKITQALAYR